MAARRAECIPTEIEIAKALHPSQLVYGFVQKGVITMKIGSVSPIIGQYNQIKAAAVRKQADAQGTVDSVELSSEALLFSEAYGAVRKSMQEAEPGQAIKVSHIMQQMRAGNYHVDIGDICDKLLS